MEFQVILVFFLSISNDIYIPKGMPTEFLEKLLHEVFFLCCFWEHICEFLRQILFGNGWNESLRIKKILRQLLETVYIIKNLYKIPS